MAEWKLNMAENGAPYVATIIGPETHITQKLFVNHWVIVEDLLSRQLTMAQVKDIF
jgi:hypothetical protein